MAGNIDFAPSKRCYNTYESYGEICVGCGCCSTDKRKAAQARLELHQRLLADRENFNMWFYDAPWLMKVQEQHVAASIKYHKEMIAKYQAILKAEGEDNG